MLQVVQAASFISKTTVIFWDWHVTDSVLRFLLGGLE